MSRLEDLGIRKMAEGPAVSLYVRGNCVAAVGATQGSTGLMTAQGLAYLVWREGAALLVSKAGETPAAPEQLEEIRQFTEDLKAALTT
ncbi:MAG: hypothetical protein KGN36_01700 [Acidobacteriota bacterium]|nr:hypothetical protein [Acidobacteriota bacterium]